MTQPVSPSSFSTCRPSGLLGRFVGQYWLSLHNVAPTYTAFPDGCVDLVLEVTANRWRSWAYGTTTRPTDIACSSGSHYLGIRFRPGQSRHFIAAAADEITDRREDLHSLLPFPAEIIAARIGTDAPFSQVDIVLTTLLRQQAPTSNYIDKVLEHIEARHGRVRVDEVCDRFGKSRRQMERAFLQTVGVPFKFFCMISRLQHAAGLIVHPSRRPLTAVAMAAGYSDQSHMTREFTRLAGVSPGRLLQQDVAFLQYHSRQ
jgi:AraC-like DNA-binding protein